MATPFQAYGQVKQQLRNRLMPNPDPAAPVEAPDPGGPAGAPSAAPTTALNPSPSAAPGAGLPPGSVAAPSASATGSPRPTGPQTIQGAAGSSSPFNYEAARDDWMGGGYDVANADAARASAAQWAQKHGIAYDGSDTITLPNGGGLIDILGNFGGGQGNGQTIARNWTAAGGNGPNPNGAGGGPGGASYAGSIAAGAGGGGGFNSQIQQKLLQQLANLDKPVTEDDPAISGELQTQNRQIDRDREARRAAMAERAAASGLLNGGASSGAFDSDVASGYEDASQRKSDVKSQLFARELGQRRDKLMQYYQMAVQSGDNEAARAIQLQIAQMGNAFNYANLAQNKSQWDDSFGLDTARWQSGRDDSLLGGF